MILRIILFVTFLLFVSCETGKDSLQNKEYGWSAQLDSTVRFQDDFAGFATGGWTRRTVVPAYSATWGARQEVELRNNLIIYQKIKEITPNPNFLEGSNERIISDFFENGMDSLQSEKLGLTPLFPYFQRIDRINAKADFAAALIDLSKAGIDHCLSFQFNHSLVGNSVKLSIGQKVLPDSRLLLSNDPAFPAMKSAYINHIQKMFALAGEPQQAAAKVYEMEKQLAALGQPVGSQTKVSTEELEKILPSISLKDYLTALNLPGDSLSISGKADIRQLELVIRNWGVKEIRALLKWWVVKQAAPYLNHAFVMESFNFNDKFLNGIKSLRPRWQRVLMQTTQYFPSATGKILSDQIFDRSTISHTTDMVEIIRFAFADAIKKSSRMNDSTKRTCLARLGALKVEIGIPKNWKKYGEIRFLKGNNPSFFSAILEAKRYNYQLTFRDNTLNGLWDNAFRYGSIALDENGKELVVPVNLIQAPYFYNDGSEPMNYGALGVEIAGKLIEAVITPLNRSNSKEETSLKTKATDISNSLEIAMAGLDRYFREGGVVDAGYSGLSPRQQFFFSWARINVVKESKGTALLDMHMLEKSELYQEAFGIKPASGDKKK